MTPKSHPIIFSAPMIRAILEGRKSMTRRVVKPQPQEPGTLTKGDGLWRTASKSGMTRPFRWEADCPYGQPGDLLWVREAWAGPVLIVRGMFLDEKVLYRERDEGWGDYKGNPPQWKSSRFMPRKFSRITLEITAIRVERVQDITEEDAEAEGISGPHDVGYPAYKIPGDTKPRYSRAAAAFEDLWDSLHAKDGFDWKANPWCWCISFRRVKP